MILKKILKIIQYFNDANKEISPLFDVKLQDLLTKGVN